MAGDPVEEIYAAAGVWRGGDLTVARIGSGTWGCPPSAWSIAEEHGATPHGPDRLDPGAERPGAPYPAQVRRADHM